MKALFDAIMTKSTGSTFITACTGGLHREYAPQKKVMPYAVMHLVTGYPKDTFKEYIEYYKVQFNIYSDAAAATTIDDIASKLMTLYDWCTLTITGYTHIYMRRVLQTCFWDGDNQNWQYTIHYEIEMQKT